MTETSVVKATPASLVKNRPDALTELKRQMLAAAGLDVVEGGERLRAALDKAAELLDAKKVTYFAKDGEVTDERVDDDGRLQLSAAKEIRELVLELFDDSSSKSKGSGDVSITVNVAGWFGDDAKPSETSQ